MKTKVEERFSEFFEKWICQLDEYLQHLRRASEDYRAKTGCEGEQELQTSVSKVTQHYKDYYTIKWALAHEDRAFFLLSNLDLPFRECIFLGYWVKIFSSA